MIKCKGYWTPSNSEGPSEFTCGYENSGDVDCDACIINGGNMSPVSGKLFRGNRIPYDIACLHRLGPQFFECDVTPIALPKLAIITTMEVGDRVEVRECIRHRVVATYDALSLAMKWFRTSNDAFFDLYGFNWVPRGLLYDRAKAMLEVIESMEVPALRQPSSTTNSFDISEALIKGMELGLTADVSDITKKIQKAINGGIPECLMKSGTE